MGLEEVVSPSWIVTHANTGKKPQLARIKSLAWSQGAFLILWGSLLVKKAPSCPLMLKQHLEKFIFQQLG